MAIPAALLKVVHPISFYPPTRFVILSNNCSAQDIIIIEEPDELDVTITLSNWNGYEIQCNGYNSGTASISINGGNGPYIKEVYDLFVEILAGNLE